jgi:hypothetical protein
MTTWRKAFAGIVLLSLLVGCDSKDGGVADAGDAGSDAQASCIMDAGPDVDPLMTCSPSGCFPFDNSVVPEAPRLQ